MNRNKKSQVVAIIPARGGSKGIPRKNIVDLCGKPLIAYTIDIALRAESVSRVIVSTDDQEIADISAQFGAEVPFLRPANLADDRADPSDVIRHALAWLRSSGYQPNVVVTLFPTHPFRTVAMVDLLVEKILQGFQNVKTVKPVVLRGTPYYQLATGGSLMPIRIQKSLSVKSTGIYYRPYGLFSGFMAKGDILSGMYYHRIEDSISLIDIDSDDDLQIAEAVLREGYFDFQGP